MMRHVYVVIDASEAMALFDLKPSRMAVTCKLVEMFLGEFFDQNPISQIGIMTMSKRTATKVCELNNSCKVVMDALKAIPVDSCEGEPSLQNCLELSLLTFKNLPKHTSKEVIILMGSLTTCDPGDINKTIDSLVEAGVRVSIIGLAAEIHVCRKLALKTKGSYNIILDEHHFRDLLNRHLQPPPANQNTESSLIRMGFPTPVSDGTPSICLCHLKTNGSYTRTGYFCPECKSKYCELPTECRICGMTLVSSAHLARSYHHLFPVKPFDEVSSPNTCFSCKEPFNTGYKCTSCKSEFCSDCDIFIHDSLHVCPGCA